MGLLSLELVAFEPSPRSAPGVSTPKSMEIGEGPPRFRLTRPSPYPPYSPLHNIFLRPTTDDGLRETERITLRRARSRGPRRSASGKWPSIPE